MSAQRGQVIWTADPQPSLAQSYGLSDVSYTSSGHPDLDQDEGEAVVSSFDQVALVLGEERDEGAGNLCITNRRLCWQPQQHPESGFAAAFTDIGLHAVASNSPGYGRPCIYVQLAGEGDTAFDDSDDDSAQQPSRELRLIPASSATLQEIFRIMCEVAAQNPDSDHEGDEGEEDMYCNEDEILAGSGADARAAMLDHFDSMLHIQRGTDMDELLEQDPDRFEDPDDLDHAPDLDQSGSADGRHADGQSTQRHVQQ